MYTKVINVPMTDDVYTGAMPTNGDCVVKDGDSEVNKIAAENSPILSKPMTFLKKKTNTSGAVIEGATFRLTNGNNIWNLTTDSSGKIGLPWAENDSATAAAFKPGDSYTLTETATADGTVKPAGSWTLSVGNDYKVTATTTDSPEETNRANDLNAKSGKFEVYNDAEPTVKYDANGGKFGDNSTEKSDVVDFGNTEISHEYAVSESQAFTPVNTDPSLRFAGWNTKYDGTGTSYFGGDKINVYRGENDCFITLYAQWSNCRKLTITNENTGGYANDDDGFDVTVTLVPAAGDDPLASNDPRLSDAWTIDVARNKAFTKFRIDGTSANNTKEFDMIPSGWTYTVKEDPTLGYTVEYKLGTQAESDYAELTGGKTGELSADTTVNIRNTRDSVVPSGLGLSDAGMLMLIVVLASILALAADLVYGRRHRRRFN